MFRVDGIAYKWAGGSSSGVNASISTRLGLEVTPTRTIFILQAGPSMLFNVTYMSPIEVCNVPLC